MIQGVTKYSKANVVSFLLSNEEFIKGKPLKRKEVIAELWSKTWFKTVPRRNNSTTISCNKIKNGKDHPFINKLHRFEQDNKWIKKGEEIEKKYYDGTHYYPLRHITWEFDYDEFLIMHNELIHTWVQKQFKSKNKYSKELIFEFGEVIIEDFSDFYHDTELKEIFWNCIKKADDNFYTKYQNLIKGSWVDIYFEQKKLKKEGRSIIEKWFLETIYNTVAIQKRVNELLKYHPNEINIIASVKEALKYPDE